MGKRIEYQEGEKINGVIYIKDIEPYIVPKTQVINRRALFICPYCGKQFITIQNLKK